MNIQQNLSLMEKLAILTDAAKYDVACTSSGADRRGDGRHMGNCLAPGVCHAFAADGRCISLLKILFTNECILTVPTARTTATPTSPAPPLPRMRSVRSPWNSTGAIISRVCS